MNTQAIQFVRRGEIVSLRNVPPTRTLLVELLRADLHGTGTKKGWNEGDCGACTGCRPILDAAQDIAAAATRAHR